MINDVLKEVENRVAAANGEILVAAINRLTNCMTDSTQDVSKLSDYVTMKLLWHKYKKQYEYADITDERAEQLEQNIERIRDIVRNIKNSREYKHFWVRYISS